MKTNFKEGDWCFHEFALKLIKKVGEYEEGEVNEVTDGFFSTGSRKLRCFPLNLYIKVISSLFTSYKDKWHRNTLPGTNWPDLARWMEQEWAEACEFILENNLGNWPLPENLHNPEVAKLFQEKEEKLDKMQKALYDLKDAEEAKLSCFGVRLLRY